MNAGKVDMRFHSNERGIALPLVLFVLVILGVIITGTFYVARLEQKTGDNSVAATQAASVAEAGVDSVLANWNTSTYNGLAVATDLAEGRGRRRIDP